MSKKILCVLNAFMLILFSFVNIFAENNVQHSNVNIIIKNNRIIKNKAVDFKFDNKSVKTCFDKKDYKLALKGILHLIDKKTLGINLAKLAIKYSSQLKKSSVVEKILKIHPILKTIKGAHSYELLLYLLKTGDYGQFFKSALFFNDTEINKKNRLLRNILRFIQKRRYSLAIKHITTVSFKSGDKNQQVFNELLTYLYIKTKKYKLALLYAQKAFLLIEKIPFKKVKTIFQLALINKSGRQAVFWGEKILKIKPSSIKNPVFLNNLSLAYIYKSKIDLKNKKKLIKKSIHLAKKSLKYKQTPSVFHTLSVAFYESGEVNQSLKYISLARSLKPVNIKYLNFYKLLLKKIKKRY